MSEGEPPEVSAKGSTPGWDPEWVARVMPVLRAVAKNYFRSEVRGMDKVPDGGVLLVSNHSGGITAYDVPLIAVAFADEFGADRRVSALGHVVARGGGKLGVGRFVLVGVLGLFDKSLVHVMEFVKERRC